MHNSYIVYMKKYLSLAHFIEAQIKNGTFKAGDKLPSVRELHRHNNASISTVLKSLDVLRGKGLIKSKEKSGYFVNYSEQIFSSPPIFTVPKGEIHSAEVEELIDLVYINPKSKYEIDFSLGVPDKKLLPINKIKKATIEIMHSSSDAATAYEAPCGDDTLRRLVVQRSLLSGTPLRRYEVITTNGCMNAFSYAFMVSMQAGDTIICESPIYFGILQLANSLKLNVIETQTHSVYGLDLEVVKTHLQQRKIKAIVTVSNFSNPLGFCMPPEHKQELVNLAHTYDCLIIEADLYGDIYFGDNRPKTCKSFDQEGRVMLCSSFSKTLAPGYRVGYIAGGTFADEIVRLKMYHNVTANSLTHQITARILQTGRYDRYLNQLRTKLEHNKWRYLELIRHSFPDNTKISNPSGGYMLWIELDQRVDTNILFERCLEKGIRIAPGRLFSLRNQYRHCLRISYGLQWNEQIEKGIQTIGDLAKQIIQ